MNNVFVINKRYEIDESLNLVKDIIEGNEIRIEPRLMHLLNLLKENEGKLVSRELLVKEIWNDYGGGDEGLTQSVSALRKILNDSNKNIIETIPKNGYILHADIYFKTAVVNTAKKGIWDKILVAAGLLILLAIIVARLPFTNKENTTAITPPAIIKDSIVRFEDSDGKDHLNTIIALGKNNKKYKLVLLGDRRPEFYINEELQHPDEMEKYYNIIEDMKKYIWQRNKIMDKK